MKRMEHQPGIGGTPIRKVLKKANLGSAPAELSKGKACKLTAVSSIANQCKKVAAGKNQFFCLFCDDIFLLRRADCPKTYVWEQMFLRTRRRDPAHGRLDDAAVCMATGLCKTVCKGCVPKLESFLSCTAGQAYFVYSGSFRRPRLWVR